MYSYTHIYIYIIDIVLYIHIHIVLYIYVYLHVYIYIINIYIDHLPPPQPTRSFTAGPRCSKQRQLLRSAGARPRMAELKFGEPESYAEQ